MSDRPAIATIKARVAEHHGVTVIDLVPKRKTRDVTSPRHTAMWLCCALTKHAATEIGCEFGDRDRKTVMNALERTDERMAADPVLKSEVDALSVDIAASASSNAASGSPARDTAFALRNEARALRERAARLDPPADTLVAPVEAASLLTP